MKRLIGYTVIVLLTLSVLFVLWRVRVPLLLFLLALVLAAALRAPADWLAVRGIPRTAALLMVYTITLIVFILSVYTIGAPLVEDLPQLTNVLLLRYEVLVANWRNSSDPLEQALAAQLPSPDGLYTALIGAQGQRVIGAGLGVALSAAELITNFVIIVTLSIYWSIARLHFERLGLSLVVARRRRPARNIWYHIEHQVGAFVRWQAVQGMLAVLLLWPGFWFLGERHPALLAVVTALLLLVPPIGTVLAFVPPVLVGLMASPTVAILAAVYLAMVLYLKSLIKPALWPHRPGSYVLLIAFIIALADAFGVIGALFAPLVFVVAEILWQNATRHFRGARMTAQEDGSTVEERLAELREQLALIKEDERPEVQSLTRRLEKLMDEAVAALPSDAPQQ
jgi:predicted PurR-regulated permease PerM